MPCQPTIAAQLLGNGGKIEPYTYYNNHGFGIILIDPII
jgi:hypothetical protein